MNSKVSSRGLGTERREYIRESSRPAGIPGNGVYAGEFPLSHQDVAVEAGVPDFVEEADNRSTTLRGRSFWSPTRFSLTMKKRPNSAMIRARRRLR